MFNNLLRISLLLLFTTPFLFAQVTVTYPTPYIVIQRDNQNMGSVHITGTLSQSADRVEARLLTVPGEPGESSENWFTLDNSVQNGSFLGEARMKGGRYNLEVRALKGGQQLGSITTVQKIGIGEVFLIVGHSNAQGSGGEPAKSNMVISMDPNVDEAKKREYENTADPDLLPKSFSPMTEGHGISPFSGNKWFWGKFGDQVVQKLNVPVLIYSAAFGGSNMHQTYMASRGEQFEHPFVKSHLRMPYINIENTLFYLVPKTGLRAILSAHGINDNGSTEEEFYTHHKGVVDFSRNTEKFRNLTWMIANSCYANGVKQQLHNAQERLMLLQDVFRGANLNSIDNSGRQDGLHFNEIGQEMAAKLWSDAVADQNFMQKSLPVMPERLAESEGQLPVTLVDFTARESETGGMEVSWSTSEELNNSHFEVQYSFEGREFLNGGTVAGAVNATGISKYGYHLPGPFNGTVYVRLKQVDLDGTVDFSKILSLEIKRHTANIFVPNPSSGLFVFRSSGTAIPRSIQVYDVSGILLIEAKNTSQLDLTGLPASVYIAVVEGNDGLRTVRRISKL